MSDTKFEKECQDTVDRIAKTLMNIYEGTASDEYYEGMTDEGYDDTNKGYYGIRKYFDDPLDIDYICNSRKEYTSARVWITIGGPGIYVDTESAEVKLTWGTTKASAPISYNVRDMIDEIFKEYFDIM